MKHRSTWLAFVPMLSFALLTACSDASESEPSVTTFAQSAVGETPGESNVQSMESWTRNSGEDLSRVDDQGAVQVEVRPRNLLSPVGGLIEFDVFMNTHSVDLSMDLATLSTLETDLGLRVAAGWWSGGSGHHVQGVLTFPEQDQSGRMILDGARTITLRLEGVDAPIREFHWERQPES